MSLNNIQLPPIVLRELFKRSLVDVKEESINHLEAVPSAFSVLGNNMRNILILVDNGDSLYLPDEQLNFLLGILAACNLTMEDVAILNIKKNKDVSYKTISTELEAGKIFLFGISPAEIGLPFDFPDYQIQSFNNQVYLTAPSLSHFKNNKTEKTKLWNCLREVFGL